MCEGAAPAAGEQSKPKRASKKSSSLNLSRCMKAPLRALRRARDMYVRSLGGCAGAGGGGGGGRGGGVTAGMLAMMPRARSVNAFGNSNNVGFGFGGSGDDDFKELVRANSKQHAQDHHDAQGLAQAIKRSQSVAPAIGRIDEDTPCNDFDGGGDDHIHKLGTIPRSKSCAVVPSVLRINNVLGVTTA